MRGVVKQLFCFSAAFAVLLFLLSAYVLPVRADGTPLSDASVELLFTQEFRGGDSVIQSVCATDDYIITLENTSKTQITGDVVTAYYKNDTDAAGNPVERYSIAMQRDDQDWEHGNCMTYNPNTGYVYVALYTCFNPELRGCVYVMDPADLSLIGTLKVSDDFNLLSIAYDPDQNVYYAQTDGDGSYRMLVLNTDFQVIDDFGPSDPTPGYNFQGFCKYGDYLIQSPLTLGLGVGDYFMAYSIPERQFVDVQSFNYGREDATKVEPEQIAPMGDGSFVTVVNNSYNDEYGNGDIYRVVFPNLPAQDTQAAEPEVTAAPVPADEEVTITTEKENMTSVETLPAEPAEEEQNVPAGKPFNPAPVIIVIVIAAGAFFVFRLVQIDLERKRRARNARAKRARKLLRESMEKEMMDMRW